MRTYSVDATVPAAAITLATALSNTQPILFTTQFGNTGTYSTSSKSTTNIPTNANGIVTGTTPTSTTTNGTTKNITLNWVIKSIEVSLTRDWGTSTAFIQLSCTLPNTNQLLPPLPDVSMFRGGIYKYLSEEDEIRIYGGYVDSVLTPITADLLDEIPFDFTDVQSTNQNPINYKSDPNKPLIPIFWGFIDKIEFSGDSSGGLMVILSCRDRVRIFSDTRVVSLESFQGKTQGEVQSQGTNIEGGDVSSIAGGDRVKILLELANAAAGNPFGGTGVSGCWKTISQGLVVRGYTYDNKTKVITQNDPREDPSSWIRTATCRTMNSLSAPRMNIWAERPPIIKGEPSAILQVLNKSPMEIIDYMAKVEERPMDFFASHINGDFVLGPRVKDTSGFDDVNRGYRTYFFNSYPSSISSPPSPNQMIIKIKSLRSTLFSFNKFVIINSTLKGTSSSLIGAVTQGFTAIPYHLQDRNPSPPCKTQVIYDGGLASYSNPQAGALQLGLAHARVWSRDTQAIHLELIGDPTLYPSESIRVYNTFLHDYQSYVVVDEAADNKQFYKTKADLGKIADQGDTISVQDKIKANNKTINDTEATYLSNNPAKIPTDINNLLIPYYSVRTVQHQITAQGERGWVTMVEAVTDI